MAVDQVAQAIGSTPLIRLDALSQDVGAQVFAKYEAANPGASIKDRAARSIIDRAEERGQIAPGRSVLVEPTSGNTGIAIAMIGAARGYDVVIVMPDSMSRERRMLMTAYGARLELTPGAEGMAGAGGRVLLSWRASFPAPGWLGSSTTPTTRAPTRRRPGPRSFSSWAGSPITWWPAWARAAPSRALPAACARRAPPRASTPSNLRKARSSRKRSQAALEPAPHGIQGIGANFIPGTLDLGVLDGALAVSTDEAMRAGRETAEREGLLVGISSGANMAAVRRLVAEHPEARGATIVTFAVDTGERYLSTPLFAE